MVIFRKIKKPTTLCTEKNYIRLNYPRNQEISTFPTYSYFQILIYQDVNIPSLKLISFRKVKAGKIRAYKNAYLWF
jgi:hypothetical protein